MALNRHLGRACPVVLGALIVLSGPKALSSAEEPSRGKNYWAFQPVEKVAPPADDSGWGRNEIDRFVLDRLREKGLEPNPDADRRTLLRRAYFDLIGLPPSPEQVEAFVNDASPGAFAKVIDELLASEHYGERWGRHWLDLARYADTSGDGADAPIPEAHLYRDYVIDAFNEDLPYDQFIEEQIAGDLLAEQAPSFRARQRQIATGYIALARRFGNGAYADMHLVIENTVSTISKGMLGLSLGCARCHDHKYDPMSVEDYYGFYGYFSSTQYPHPSTEHGRQRKNFVELTGGGLAYAVTDKKDENEVGDARIHQRGEPRALGAPAPRGFIDVIDASDADIPAKESGRLQLAQWIASPENPLTARVMVNRIWQYHFGKGLVPTPNNFGTQGKPPTHPRLLDWLANAFIENGWSMKKMHRLIMLSRTYQLSGAEDEGRLAKDPQNQWYWRYPRRRLAAEPIRDAVLAVSGRLKQGNPGPHPFPEPNEKGEYNFTQHRPFTEDYSHQYRTVYLPSRRLGRHPYLEMFNGPDPNECTAGRKVSTVPLQSLFWMNSQFLRDNARSMARRLISEKETASERVSLGYGLAYSREPTPQESEEAVRYVQEYAGRLAEPADSDQKNLRAWTSFCRVLLASNEFVYLE